MARRSDFRVIEVQACFGDTNDCFGGEHRFVGNGESWTFEIEPDAQGVGGGYLLINSFDVGTDDHRVLINDKALPGRDLVEHSGARRWQTRMKRIRGGQLQPGSNTLTIQRATGQDNFLVGDVVVHWREDG